MSDSQRLHIDDDWKAEAAREKERLSREADDAPQAGMGEATFNGIINTLAMQAMVGLGGLGGPAGQQIPPNPELAKHFIDLLEVLDKKTAGNVTPDEKRILDTTLYHLRMAYVEMTTAATSMPPETPGPGMHP
ncbi:MAG: DUF1844 domain-containing protein [Phycisphaerae bacterium]